MKTICRSKEYHDSLRDMALEPVTFAIHRYTNVIPPGWDSPAFCSNLAKSLELANLALDRECDQPNVKNSASLQSRIYRGLINIRPDPVTEWVKFLNAGANMFIRESGVISDASPSPSFNIGAKGFCELGNVLMEVSENHRLLVIKTLVNSWSASRRLHENNINMCFFCGEAKDDLPHYLVCDPFWAILVSVAGLSPNLLGLDVLTRVGLKFPL